MSWDYYEVEQQKARVQKEIAKRKKRGEAFECLAAPQGNAKLVRTFWGQAWCKQLEHHSDYEHRLPRGRSYLRQGNVYNLKITPGEVSAVVAGSELYDTRVLITPLPAKAWQQLVTDCAGQVASLLDLLGGKLGDGVLRAITDPERGLFPKSQEIRFLCSCPDDADLCKHVAAVLYGVGVLLDTQPDLLFVLRSVDPTELLAAGARQSGLSAATSVDTALGGEDLSSLFGIDLASESPLPPAEAIATPPTKLPKSSARQPVTKASKTKPTPQKTAQRRKKRRAS